MRTLFFGHLLKRSPSNWPPAEPTVWQRLSKFLLRDLLPSIVMILIVSLFALFIGVKIDQSKSSRADRVVEISSHP